VGYRWVFVVLDEEGERFRIGGGVADDLLAAADGLFDNKGPASLKFDIQGVNIKEVESMAEDSIQRIFKALDDILQRLTKVETILEGSQKCHEDIEKDILAMRRVQATQEERIVRLEQAKAGVVAIREFAAWAAAIASAMYAYLH